ncbi:MAG: hypothetical protein ACRDPO_03800 [Streptosporangiaceae bacterium]
MRQQDRRRLSGFRLAAAAASVTLVGGLCAIGGSAAGEASVTHPANPANPASPAQRVASCHLGHGIKHVVQIGFDNIHFFRDNPNVPSDLELMPNLMHFIDNNGVMLSNSHTPLIAHTGDDLLTTATGLYGDRQGDGIANDYQTYNPDGTTDSATVFTYWNDAIDDTSSTPTTGHDTNPNLVYSKTPPATTAPAPKPDKVAPAPWVPYTRAGCNVGEIATVNQELENPNPDLAEVFGKNSPEEKQYLADTDSFKDPETADYAGLGVHCARHNAFCADATAVKFGETKATHTAVADRLPDEPGGYRGYQALFGSRYITPAISGGQDSLKHHGFEVTNAAGNLVDENGNQINGAFLTNHPGFPGYGGINASQSLAYAADMLEGGVPVVNLYMADLHGNEEIPALSADCKSAPDALGSGSACYIAQAQYYNAAFGTFLKRLAADGITQKNTLFVVSSDEGDHEAGANVRRAIKPTPATCNGATVSGDTVTPATECTYPAGSFGELDVNATGLLSSETGNTTPFSMEGDTAPEFYLTGNPGPNTSTVRTFERDVAKLKAADPYTGKGQFKLANYLANPVEEGILHFVDADPARTPTLATFARPDYFIQPTAVSGSNCFGADVCQNTGFAWDHGDYAAEINTNYVGFVGPGVKHLGVDGPAANKGTTSSGPDSGQIEVADDHFRGPWVDEADIRPTIMYLAGLRDDYQVDGRVISQILSHPDAALRPSAVTTLGECYKQLNSSVGDFGAETLIASTRAIESSAKGDKTFLSVDSKLRSLEIARDRLAEQIKGELAAAAFADRRVSGAGAQTRTCEGLIAQATRLAASS